MKKSLLIASLAVISMNVLGMNPLGNNNPIENNPRHTLTPDSSPRSDDKTKNQLKRITSSFGVAFFNWNSVF